MENKNEEEGTLICDLSDIEIVAILSNPDGYGEEVLAAVRRERMARENAKEALAAEREEKRLREIAKASLIPPPLPQTQKAKEKRIAIFAMVSLSAILIISIGFMTKSGVSTIDIKRGVATATKTKTAKEVSYSPKLEKKAMRGNAEAQYILGLCYFKGQGISMDKETGVKFYKDAARKGHAEAQYALGHCYFEGQGVSQSYYEGMHWHHMAAEQGHVQAQFALGFRYLNGEGVSKDLRESVKWFRKASEQGYDLAETFLDVALGNIEMEKIMMDLQKNLRW
jgi:FOG: TPR repeat, SEL1 subfamily